MYLHVADPDGTADRWRQAGISVGDVEDKPWGMREFTIEDPSGNQIRVGTNA